MLTPDRIPPPGQGLRFRRSDGHSFRPLYVDQSGLRLQWERDYYALLARSPLAEFMAEVEFDLRNDHYVVFTKMEGGREVLSGTTGIDHGSRMPRASFQAVKEAEKNFKSLVGKGVLSEDEEAFIASFSLPDPRTFPSAYRVRKAGLFSRRRLFVLWGMVPESPRNDPVISIALGSSSVSNRSVYGESPDALASSDASELLDGSQDQLLYDDSRGWPKWLELLVVFCGLALILSVLWFLFSLLAPGCEVSSDSEAEVKKAPSAEHRKAEIKERIAGARKGLPEKGTGNPGADATTPLKIYALEQSLAAQEEAELRQREALLAEQVANAAGQKAKASGRAEDDADAKALRKQAEAKKADAKSSEALAERAYQRPQETIRLRELEQNERLKVLPSQSGEAEALRRGNPALPLPPDKEREARNRLYVAPKDSTQDGEIIVRRFKADELVARKGIKLHLEADANGRKDFKVNGWAFGLTPMIETERLEGFVPVGPDLSIETPLDLYFEYRGADGMIHEDCAPFVITGDIEFRLSLEIEHAKEAPAVEPVPQAKPGA
jgi:hypothetical protein